MMRADIVLKVDEINIFLKQLSKLIRYRGVSSLESIATNVDITWVRLISRVTKFDSIKIIFHEHSHKIYNWSTLEIITYRNDKLLWRISIIDSTEYFTYLKLLCFQICSQSLKPRQMIVDRYPQWKSSEAISFFC